MVKIPPADCFRRQCVVILPRREQEVLVPSWWYDLHKILCLLTIIQTNELRYKNSD